MFKSIIRSTFVTTVGRISALSLVVVTALAMSVFTVSAATYTGSITAGGATSVAVPGNCGSAHMAETDAISFSVATSGSYNIVSNTTSGGLIEEFSLYEGSYNPANGTAGCIYAGGQGTTVNLSAGTTYVVVTSDIDDFGWYGTYEIVISNAAPPPPPPPADSDGDGVPDSSDVCPGFDDNVDTDSDGTPDGCDTQDNNDDDGDTVQNWQDVCPGSDDRVDSDSDGTPDGCDGQDNNDDDGDTVQNWQDVCPGSDDRVDSDSDGTPDGCDGQDNGDDDNDTVENWQDVCPSFDDLVDTDGDGTPDGCDLEDNGDADGDTVENWEDNCPTTPNATQRDVDNDGIGDACDPLNNNDPDGDGVNNNNDDCPERGDEGYGVQENGCPPHVVLPPDDRINWQYGDGSVIVYDHADGVAVYCYNGNTWLGMHVNQAAVDNAPVSLETVLVQDYQEYGCHIAFYILDTGEFQINIWTWDGKLYELVADNLDFANATMRYFDPGE